jgi:hypothetical protein
MWSEFTFIIFLIIVIAHVIYIYRCSRCVIERGKYIKTLFRQCARWSTASIQDTNPVVANIHANYAAAYLYSLEDLFTADEISSATNTDYKTFREGIQQNQDIVTKNMIQACPNFAKQIEGSSILVSKIAGEL